MLSIPQEENPDEWEDQEEKSNVDVHEAVGRKLNGPAASEVSDPLGDLDQFSAPESPSPERSRSTGSGSLGIPEPPNRYSDYRDDYPLGQPSNSQAGFSGGFSGQPNISTDMIQEITESVVEEKWDELMDKVGDLRLWKEKINSDMTSIKQEILRTQNRFENLQAAVLGKVHDYNENIININNEMKALEKVFEKILQPLTENVKELSKITDKLKKK